MSAYSYRAARQDGAIVTGAIDAESHGQASATLASRGPFALAVGRGVIPALVIGMIRAGERGSQLGTALEQIAAHLEQEADLVAHVRQALTYPLLLAVVGATSVLVITTVVVPRFAAILGDLGQQLPPATRLLLGISQVLTRFWIPLLVIVVAATWSAIEWIRRPTGRDRKSTR